jgi:hypothetical protein
VQSFVSGHIEALEKLCAGSRQTSCSWSVTPIRFPIALNSRPYGAPMPDIEVTTRYLINRIYKPPCLKIR